MQPQAVIETAEAAKPRLIIRRAAAPSRMVSGWLAKRPMSHSGQARHTAVPVTIITVLMSRVRRWIFPLLLSCAEVVANQGADSLNQAVGRHIDEGLQLVIGTQHHNIHLRKLDEDAVQSGNQQRRQCHVQAGRDTHVIEPSQELPIKMQVLPGKANRDGICQIHCPVEQQLQGHADARCPGCACNAHRRNGAHAENQDGVQDDIHNAAEAHGDHGSFHFSQGLVDFLHPNEEVLHAAEQQNNVAVGFPLPECLRPGCRVPGTWAGPSGR